MQTTFVFFVYVFCVNDLETIHGVNEQLKMRSNKVHKIYDFRGGAIVCETLHNEMIYNKLLSHFFA